jgi:hypothetical protein
MRSMKAARLSIAIDQSSLRAFQEACADCGAVPEEVLKRWVKFALRRHRERKPSSRPFHRLPGEVMAKKSKAKRLGSRRKSALLPRLQIRVKKVDYDNLMAVCKERHLNVSRLIRLWVAYLLKWHKQGGRIERKAEPEAFKDDPRAMVWDGYLQVHLQDADTLTALKDACRQRGVEHSRVMRGWISHILGLYRRGLDLNPPELPKRRRRPGKSG